MELRWYQQEAVDAAIAYTGRAGTINLPTGAGKSVVIARIAAHVLQQGGRVLNAIHNGDLVRQNGQAIAREVSEHVGIVSASAGKKDWDARVVVCSVGTAFRHAEDMGRFDLVIIDECHLVSEKPDTMYGKLLAGVRKVNPECQLIGLSATPWRMDGPLIGRGVFEDEIYSAGTPEAFTRLLSDGYLSQLVPGPTSVVSMGGVTIASNGDYSEGSFAHKIEPLLPSLIPEMLQASMGRHKGIVFAPTVHTAELIVGMLRGMGETAEIITGKTPKGERKSLIDAFRNRNAFRWMVSVSALTTGFDVPDIDTLVCFRPTLASALWVQMLGRLTRVHPDKVDGLVLDFTGNTERCGPIDNPIIPKPKENGSGEAIKKHCPVCEHECSASQRQCPVCGYEFPVAAKRENVVANGEPPMSVFAGRKMAGTTPCILPSTRTVRIVVDREGRQWCRVSWTDRISLLLNDRWAARLGVQWGKASAMVDAIMANGTKPTTVLLDTSSDYAKISIPKIEPAMADVWWPVTSTPQLRGMVRRLVLGIPVEPAALTRAATAAGVGCQYGRLLPDVVAMLKRKLGGDAVTIKQFDQWCVSLQNR